MTDKLGQTIKLGDTAIYTQSKGFSMTVNVATVVEIQTTFPDGRLLLLPSGGKTVLCKPLNAVIYKGYGECLTQG